MSDSIVIATRESPLALWQAEHVQALLAKRYPEKDVHLLGITTKGDRILDKTLSKIGGKGLFVKELDRALPRNPPGSPREPHRPFSGRCGADIFPQETGCSVFLLRQR